MFEIIKCEDSFYTEYVLLIDSEDLDYEIYEIFDSLKEKNGNTFDVLVDCYLRTGNAYNRFIKICFLNGVFKESIIVNPRSVDDYLKNQSFNYIFKNNELLNNSALSNREKEVFKLLIN